MLESWDTTSSILILWNYYARIQCCFDNKTILCFLSRVSCGDLTVANSIYVDFNIYYAPKL